MFSKKILKRFVKDYSLPIGILEEPYFTYYLDLYDDTHNTHHKFELFKKAIKKCGGEEEFLQTSNSVMQNIIDKYKDMEEYQLFNTEDNSKYNIPNKSYCSKDVFNKNNKRKYFISIDLVKANYQALKYVSSKLVFDTNSYEELISEFTDLEYLKNSKHLRQVIFGNLNPKRQVKVERYITERILDLLISNNDFSEDMIRMVSSDEIVIELSVEKGLNMNKEKTDLITQLIKENINIDVDIEVYQLKTICYSDNYFVKEFINKKGFELMCAPLILYAQLYKTYLGMEINEYDQSFFHEGFIAMFKKSLFMVDNKEREVQEFQLGGTAYMVDDDYKCFESEVCKIELKNSKYNYDTYACDFNVKDIGHWVFKSKEERNRYLEVIFFV